MSLVTFISLLSQTTIEPDPPPDGDILMGDTETLWGDTVITFSD